MVKLLFTLFGPTLLLSQRSLAQYQSDAESLFFSINEAIGTKDDDKIIVDLSKVPDRLEILMQSEVLDVYCIFLERDSRAVYESTMKRPKRTRSWIPFKPFRESLWLALRSRQQRKIFKRIDENRGMKVDWQSFLADPQGVMNRVTSWLDLEACNVHRKIDIRNQHVFVGNRWLFRLSDPLVFIKKQEEVPELTLLQKFAFRLFNR